MHLDVRNNIRSMDAEGVPRVEIARKLCLSRNDVARYAGMSPEPPCPRSDSKLISHLFPKIHCTQTRNTEAIKHSRRSAQRSSNSRR